MADPRQLEFKLRAFLDLKDGSRIGQFWSDCPFCPDEKRRLGISIREQMFAVHCFHCGYSGNPASLLRDLGGKWEGRAPVYRRISLETWSQSQRDFATRPKDNPAPPCSLPREFSQLDRRSLTHKSAWDYINSRGHARETILAFGMGYCLRGKFSGRIVFPIHYEGALVGYQGRAIADDLKPKYRFSDDFQASDYLFNFDRACHSTTVVIMEGIFDVLSLPDCSVAVFGNMLSETQTLQVIRTWKKAIVMLDPQEKANARRIFRKLSPFMDTRVAVLSRTDPGASTQKEIQAAIKSARNKERWIL